MNEEEVYRILQKLTIEYEEFRHPPVYTVEEAEIYWKDINAVHCKNLFFRDNKGRRHFLVIIRHDKQLNIGKLGEDIGSGRLSFASEERLMRYLGLRPGSVSPFGLINDNENQVEVFIDESIENVDRVAFHPNNNEITVTLTISDFERFMGWTGNKYRYIDI